jgi:hypothetical protein
MPNPTPQQIIAGLVHFNNTELPKLRHDIEGIGTNLHNARLCIERLHNIVTYLVRHCLQNVVIARQAEQSQVAIEDHQNEGVDDQTALAIAMSSPAGVAVEAPSPQEQSQPLPAFRHVVVGRSDDATTKVSLSQAIGGPMSAMGALDPEPEVGDVPLVIIGKGGSKVIPPKGSGLAPKTFAPGQPVDTTFVATPTTQQSDKPAITD